MAENKGLILMSSSGNNVTQTFPTIQKVSTIVLLDGKCLKRNN
ncbi:unnamed protein product [Brassica rapa]|uniref:Uncharacterized protein n=1 Tax=Brassica campestris TaxID=3711 RepID=A0A8D9G1N9_BRACM|nr:unnamed protein product [Brassica rapa]